MILLDNDQKICRNHGKAYSDHSEGKVDGVEQPAPRECAASELLSALPIVIHTNHGAVELNGQSRKAKDEKLL